MTEARITRKPEPCDMDGPRTEHETHRHEDGRVCVWEEGAWVTVNTKSETVHLEGQKVDQHAVGLYGKFQVQRRDKRDQAGGDRAEAAPHYFVLDPIFDPLSRVAMAAYALVAREHGYDKLADDLEANLKSLARLQAEAMDTQDPEGTKRSLRAVTTWTYDGTIDNYAQQRGDRPGADEMAALDMHNLAEEGSQIEDLLGMADSDGDIATWVLPNA